MFEDLFIESGYARPVLKNIDILHVDELLFHLAVQLRGSRGLSRTLATDEMKTTHYDYTPGNNFIHSEKCFAQWILLEHTCM